MTTVNDIADILRIVREQPEWADALRGALLSQELLELPQRFAEFVATTDKRFAALEGDVAELKSDVAELKSDVSEIKKDIVSIKGDINRQTGDIGNLRGAKYEQNVGNNIHSIVGQYLNIRRVRVLKGYKAFDEIPFFDLIYHAEEQGLIDRQQQIEVGNVDIVLQGIKYPEQSPIYAVLEVSVTVANNDIERAGDRADTLLRATGEPTLPVVIGANIDEARQALAAERGVTLITIAD